MITAGIRKVLDEISLIMASGGDPFQPSNTLQRSLVSSDRLQRSLGQSDKQPATSGTNQPSDPPGFFDRNSPFHGTTELGREILGTAQIPPGIQNATETSAHNLNGLDTVIGPTVSAAPFDFLGISKHPNRSSTPLGDDTPAGLRDSSEKVAESIGNSQEMRKIIARERILLEEEKESFHLQQELLRQRQEMLDRERLLIEQEKEIAKISGARPKSHSGQVAFESTVALAPNSNRQNRASEASNMQIRQQQTLNQHQSGVLSSNDVVNRPGANVQTSSRDSQVVVDLAAPPRPQVVVEGDQRRPGNILSQGCSSASPFENGLLNNAQPQQGQVETQNQHFIQQPQAQNLNKILQPTPISTQANVVHQPNTVPQTTQLPGANSLGIPPTINCIIDDAIGDQLRQISLNQSQILQQLASNQREDSAPAVETVDSLLCLDNNSPPVNRALPAQSDQPRTLPIPIRNLAAMLGKYKLKKPLMVFDGKGGSEVYEKFIRMFEIHVQSEGAQRKLWFWILEG